MAARVQFDILSPSLLNSQNTCSADNVQHVAGVEFYVILLSFWYCAKDLSKLSKDMNTWTLFNALEEAKYFSNDTISTIQTVNPNK